MTLGNELFVVNLIRHSVVKTNRTAIALGFAPDGRTLWVVGQKSKVAALKIAA